MGGRGLDGACWQPVCGWHGSELGVRGLDGLTPAPHCAPLKKILRACLIAIVFLRKKGNVLGWMGVGQLRAGSPGPK